MTLLTTYLSRRKTLVGAGLLAATAFPVAASARAAQSASNNPMAGTTIETLASGVPSLTPDHTLLLLRVTMDPGVNIPPHSHPGPVALSVSRGQFGTKFYEGKGQVTRAANAGTPGPIITMAPGDDITMQPGDFLFYDGAVHTMRNDGSGQLVMLISALFKNGAPGFMFMQMPATPTS